MLIVDKLIKSFSGQTNSNLATSKADSGNDILSVNNVSFNLEPNEIFAVLGENGSGKSTLLKLIAGLLQPDSGSISLNNELVIGPDFKLVAGQENIKLIHQNYNLLPNKSVKDNILYAMRFFSKEYQKQKLEELLSLCHLENVTQMLPKQISGGEQQRTAIAAAISTPTDLLLLDEPFSNLDTFNKEILKVHLSNIAKTTSILYVTHDAQEALSVANRIGVFKNGKFLQIDTPYNLYNSPVNVYAAKISGLVNILSVYLLFKKDKGDFFAIRPENIHISTQSFYDVSGYVKSVSYLGAQYLLRVTVAEGVDIILYSSEFQHNLGEKLYLSFDENKLVFW